MSKLKKIKRAVSILLLVAAVLPAAGCWDRRELEDQAFVQTIGIDKGQNNQLLVTFRISIPSKAGLGQTAGGGGGGEGSVADQSSLLTAVNAPTIPAAISLASGFVNRDINLMHTKAIVFGESLAKEGVAPVIALISRYRELRRNIFMCVTEGEAHEFLEQNKPDLEKSYAKWWEGVKMMQAREGVHPGTLFQQFVTDVETMGKEGTMMYVAINEEAKKEDPTTVKIPPSLKEGNLDIKAGEIPRTGGNQVEFLGSAVFRGDKLADILTLNETKSLLLLGGGFKKAFYTTPDPRTKGAYISVEVEQGSPPVIIVDIDGEKISIKEKLSLEGDLISLQTPIEYATEEPTLQFLEKAIESHIRRRSLNLVKKLQRLESDAIGYGDYARRHFLTQTEWEEFRWLEKFADATVEVEVNFDIRRTGMQGKQPQVFQRN